MEGGRILAYAVEDPGLDARGLERPSRALGVAGPLDPRIGDQERSPAAELARQLAETAERAFAEEDVDAAQVGGPGGGRTLSGRDQGTCRVRRRGGRGRAHGTAAFCVEAVVDTGVAYTRVYYAMSAASVVGRRQVFTRAYAYSSHTQRALRQSLAARQRSPLSNQARSAKSLGRPDARLLRINTSRPRTGSWIPSMTQSNLVSHASSNSTPSMAVRMSMRLGGIPIWKKTPGVVRSSTVRDCRGAPNAASACQTRVALSGVGRIQISISPVARGRPCPARAYAPTNRNSACWADNSDNISRKSWFSNRLPHHGPGVQRQLPHHTDALFCRHDLRVMGGLRIPGAKDSNGIMTPVHDLLSIPPSLMPAPPRLGSRRRQAA